MFFLSVLEDLKNGNFCSEFFSIADGWRFDNNNYKNNKTFPAPQFVTSQVSQWVRCWVGVIIICLVPVSVLSQSVPSVRPLLVIIIIISPWSSFATIKVVKKKYQCLEFPPPPPPVHGYILKRPPLPSHPHSLYTSAASAFFHRSSAAAEHSVAWGAEPARTERKLDHYNNARYNKHTFATIYT